MSALVAIPLITVLLINIVTFALYGIDKMKSEKGEWRISEFTLLLWAFLLGSVGAVVGMRVFHHKTLHWKFRILVPLFLFLHLLLLVVIAASFYFLSYSLRPSGDRTPDYMPSYNKLAERAPEAKQWIDSLKQCGALRDTFIMRNAMEGDTVRLHAYYVKARYLTDRTAVLVHGYMDCALGMAHIARMYSCDLGFNVFMPDLQYHGLSGGEAIQMGWKDCDDVLRWAKIADSLFTDRTICQHQRMVLHGVSMGGACVMMISGRDYLPDYIRCFVDDCGYTSVWDEFEGQLKEQFGLPSFPLLYSTSLLCKMKYGWSFGEASAIGQVKQCRKPMLFIHGDADTYVPTEMVKKLYKVKPEPKELWVTSGVKHAQSYHDFPLEYRLKVKSFLGRHL